MCHTSHEYRIAAVAAQPAEHFKKSLRVTVGLMAMPPVPFGAAAALGSLPSVALSSATAPASVPPSAGGRKAINPPLEGPRTPAGPANSAAAVADPRGASVAGFDPSEPRGASSEPMGALAGFESADPRGTLAGLGGPEAGDGDASTMSGLADAPAAVSPGRRAKSIFSARVREILDTVAYASNDHPLL